MREKTLVLIVLMFSASLCLADCPSADVTGDCFVDFNDFALIAAQWPTTDYNDVATMANQWLTGVPNDPRTLFWVSIADPGVSGHEGFNGEMSKYETTNAQYCEFLNAARASRDIYVRDGKVYGSNGFNSGDDFVDEVYFKTYAASSYSQITYNGLVFSVRSRDSHNMRNHPVVEVSWYGATAFCNYYGYRLPTEWEWQAVADNEGGYNYGCGITINQSKANYNSYDYANPLDLSSYPYTSPVNHYPSYGYGMNDMAGNVFEWTASWYSDARISRVARGGCWYNIVTGCRVGYRLDSRPNHALSNFGFRVCR